jgi:lysophospholipase L1-like esterase
MIRLAFTFLCLVLVSSPGRAAEPFALRDGDRVVFYGDSITDQRLYTTFTESYVVTRFPKMKVTFVHSGWGGDRVSGGGGGPIDVRLARDVIAYKPTVMTIMLGMNDASYRPFDQKIFDQYANGYKHIIEKVKSEAPGVRFTLIVPSPFDDVTRAPTFEGGYNAVLLRYGDFVKSFAAEVGATVADLNTSVVEATRKAMAVDAANAKKLNPDRVHPGPSGQLLMAAALLKAWNAPATVSDVQLQVAGSDVKQTAANTKVTDVTLKDGTLTWNQLDESLPMPIDVKDPLIALAVRSSEILPTLDAETLKADGLSGERYALKIDGSEVATFTKEELAKGVNLATLATPMLAQSLRVHALTLDHNNLHFVRWRNLQVPLQRYSSPHLKKALEELDRLEEDQVEKQWAAAQPIPHRFELVPK